MNKLLTAAGLAGASINALAHSGHGAEGAHWHATDAWGFALAGVVVALLVWMRRGK
ncbi:MAG: hypothetical protein ACRC4O_10130 [Giesbergeria sp.]